VLCVAMYTESRIFHPLFNINMLIHRWLEDTIVVCRFDTEFQIMGFGIEMTIDLGEYSPLIFVARVRVHFAKKNGIEISVLLSRATG
jgi:hypothetical protein